MTTIDDLRAGVSGSILTSADPEWDAARLFHSGIGRPDLIVRASDVEDVRSAVTFAAQQGLPVLVRSGGHSMWGTVPGGVTIDLAALSSVTVEGSTVRAGGGATWGGIATTLAAHGLGISSGDTASVGVGGLTLGGGIGWMVRAWGLAADQLVGAQLVTAAGDVVEVDAHNHPGLFWALRGGGGNFGVVTRFDFAAHPLDGVVFAELQVTGDPRAVLRALRDTMADAPRELTVTYMDVPAMDPSAPAGAMVAACWIGRDEHAARRVLAPLLATEGVIETALAARSYPEVLLEAPPFDPENPMPGFLGGNTLLAALDDDVIEQLVAVREQLPASVLFLRSLGGAYGDVRQEDSAFPGRAATWFAMAGAFDLPHLSEGERARVLRDWEMIERRGLGYYSNFSVSTDPGIAARVYPPATMERLAVVKRVWDPKNVFRRNHNIRPE